MINHDLRHLDLFSGIGGFSFAFEAAGFRTVAFSEVDPIANVALDYWFPGVPNLGSVKGIGKEFLKTFGVPHVITGGVPCQAISLVGKGLGPADPRWLWPEFIRVVGALRPCFAVAENPPAILTHDDGRTFNGISGAMAEIGFDCMWEILPAEAFGAGHRRERAVLIFANSESICERGSAAQNQSFSGSGEARQELSGDRDFVSTADSLGVRRSKKRDAKDAAGRAARGKGGMDAGREAQDGTAADRAIDGRKEEGKHRPAKNPRSRIRSISTREDTGGMSTDRDGARLQGHPGDGQGERGSQEGRPIAPQDLRGRVSRPDWWHEHVTGIPVLVHGLPSKLVEAYCRVTGNAIVPQVFVPIAEALKQMIYEKTIHE